MKKIFVVALLVLAAHVVAPIALAEDTTCVSQYGGGVVCGTRTPVEPHMPVNAALGDTSTTLIGFVALALAGAVYVYSRKNTASSSLI